MKQYSSNNNGQWHGKIDVSESVNAYEYQRNYSGLILFVGLLVASLVVFAAML